MQDEISRKMETLQRAINNLREEEIAARQEELLQLANEMNKFEKKKYAKIGETEKQLWDSINTKFQRVIEEFAVTNGYTLIFDAAEGRILYKNLSATNIDHLVLPELRHAY